MVAFVLSFSFGGLRDGLNYAFVERERGRERCDASRENIQWKSVRFCDLKLERTKLLLEERSHNIAIGRSSISTI